MTAYRTRVRTVTAVQWTDTNEAAVKAIAGRSFHAVDPEDRTEDPDATGALLSDEHCDWLPVVAGDWIVREADGWLTVMNDTAFTEMYEPAEVAS